jgi:hypothetical protein
VLDDESEKGATSYGRTKVIAGLLALVCGILALSVIVGLSLWLKPAEPVSQIVSGAVSAIASITAAYFGIKLGNDNATAHKEQAEKALVAQREESELATVFAGLLDPAQAQRAFEEFGVPRSPS